MPRRLPTPPPPGDDDDLYDGPSRGQRKRDAQAYAVLGDELIELPPAELDGLDLDERLRDAIDLARSITAHGGKARQRQFVAKLLRKTDVEPIRTALEARAQAGRQAARDFHRLETWRDRLVAEGEPAIAAVLASHPQLDAARLRSLVEDARRERAEGRAPAFARELFRWLRESLAGAEPPRAAAAAPDAE
jgi:ribosome-associated protein